LSTIIVDASVMAKWLLPERGTPEARALLAGGGRFLAPDLARAEVANVLRKRVSRREIDPEDAIGALRVLDAAGVEFASSVALVEPALRIALAHTVSVFDALYLALAAQRGAALVTADERLYRATRAGRFSLGVRLLPT
jgi:predicted nucleic acid-binding protein